MSEISKITPLPDGWKWAKLGEVGQFESGGTPSKEKAHFWNGQIPFVTGADITDFYVSANNARAFLSTGGLESGKTAKCYPGTVLFVTRTRVGRVGIARELVAASQDLSPFICSPSTTPEYVCWYLLGIGDQLTANCRGAIIQGLKRDYIHSIQIPLPPIAEQQRIAAILSVQMESVKRARQAARERLEAINALPAACLREVFNEIIPLSVEQERDEAPDGWQWVALEKLARLESGHTPSRRRPDWWGGDIPWLALPDIRVLDGRTVYETGEHTNPKGIANSSARILPAGTVCLSRTASVGYVTVMGRPMATSQDFVNWVCGPNLWPEFFKFLLTVARRYLHRLSSGAVHKTIYMPTVKAFFVCVPPLDQQKYFAARLSEQMSAIDVARTAAQEQLKSIEALPAKLLQRAFRGELTADFRSAEQRPVLHLLPSTLSIPERQAAIIAYTAHELGYQNTFGRVFCAKTLYLAQEYAGVALEQEPERLAAGPVDFFKLLDAEKYAKEKQWVRVDREEGRYRYYRGCETDEALAIAATVLGDKRARFDHLLRVVRSLDTAAMEMVATLFAAWNDLLAAGREADFAAIHEQVQPHNWHPAKAIYPETVWRHWYQWMKQQNIVPDGSACITKYLTSLS